MRRYLSALLLIACGHRDGLVGVQELSSVGGASSAGGAGASGAAGAGDEAGAAGAAGNGAMSGFFDEFAENTGAWEELLKLPDASVLVGVADARGRDGNVAELRFPGHPEYGPADQVGAKLATELDSSERFHFGTYRTRLAFGSCAPSEETVMAFLGYFSDGQDEDADGIVDELLISMQVLCGTPSRMYLTVFTDYEESPALRFRKLSRVIDFASGEVADTPASDEDDYGATRSDSSLVMPELFAPEAFYELGFEWHSDSLRFFLVQGGSERQLWTVTGAERVPQRPVHLVYHAWHPDSHWYPTETPADYPQNDVVMLVDWVSFEPE